MKIWYIDVIEYGFVKGVEKAVRQGV